MKTRLLIIIAIAIIGSLFGIREIIALDNDYQFNKSERPHADALAKLDEYEATNSDANFQKLSEIAVLDSDLKILGSEWELMSIATVSTTEPFEVTKLVAYLRLIDSPSNAQQCESNVEATIVYDAKTGEVLEKNIPLLGVCEKPLEIGKRTETTFLPEFIPQAFASSDRAFLTSEQGSPSGHHGGFGYIMIPTLDETANPDSIFNEQDSQVSFTYNQIIGGEFFQVGWYASTVQKALVFADEYTYNDLVPRGISGITWSNNAYATVYIECGANDDYYIKMYHNGSLWSHDTDYDCDNTTDNDSSNNSVFLENAKRLQHQNGLMK